MAFYNVRLRRLPAVSLLLAIFLLSAAGGAVSAAPEAPPSAIRFREVGPSWGIDFHHHHGGSGQFYMPETMGSGVVVWDYDGDGDPDLFFVDSGPLPGYQGGPTGSVLYRNEGLVDGTPRFVDVTAASGIHVEAYGMGATAGDVDGDGDPDLYVTAFGRNQLFRNNGDGTFTDVTAKAGVGDDSWSSSAAFADLDRDGDLDLYVTNYVDFTLDNNRICGDPLRKLRSYCHPDVYDGLPDHYYRNRGDGTFEDATAAAGFGSAHGKGLGVAVGDFDGDGWPDVYVANDMTPNNLFHNRGDGTFEDVALTAGTAVSDTGNPEAGMGVAVGDLDGDGHEDIMVTNLDLQTNALYGNVGGDLFLDRRFIAHLGESSMYKVGFGVLFADLDRDGDLDVTVANGHIIHNVEQWGTGSTYKQPNQVFENLGKGVFREVPDPGLTEVRSSRGLAAGDLDGDGDLDLAINDSNDRSEVYENLTSPAGHGLEVDLVGRESNREGIGAKVEIEVAGRHQTAEVRTASSYESQNALTLPFGLGAAKRVDRLTVHWPSGQVQEVLDLPADTRVRLFEPAAAKEPARPSRPAS